MRQHCRYRKSVPQDIQLLRKRIIAKITLQRNYSFIGDIIGKQQC